MTDTTTRPAWADMQLGQEVEVWTDERGRDLRIDDPNGSWQRGTVRHVDELRVHTAGLCPDPDACWPIAVEVNGYRADRRANAVRPISAAPERFEPKVDDVVLALEYDVRPDVFVRAKVTEVQGPSYPDRRYRVQLLAGGDTGAHYYRSLDMLKPLEEPAPAEAEKPELGVGMRVRIAEDASTYARPDTDQIGYVDPRFQGAEGTIVGRGGASGNWQVQLGDDPHDYNYIHPDYLTPTEPAALRISHLHVGTKVQHRHDGGPWVDGEVLFQGAGWVRIGADRGNYSASDTYGHDVQYPFEGNVRLPEAAQPEPAAEPFDITKVKVGDRVEVYSGINGNYVGRDAQSSGRDYSWKEGTVKQVDGLDSNLPLRVEVDGGLTYWHYGVNIRGIQSTTPAPAPAEDPLADAKAAAVEKALAELKGTIGDRTMALAKEHGWCSEAEAALREMGIDPDMRLGGEVTVRFRVSADVGSRVDVNNPARVLKENIMPELRAKYGLSDLDVEVIDVQVNRVNKSRKGA